MKYMRWGVGLLAAGCAAVLSMQTAQAVPTPNPGPAAQATAIATENVTLVPQLQALGGVESSDGSWMVMPDGTQESLAPMAFSDCTSGWVCLWKDGSYSGRMLKWSDSGTAVAHLSDYGFNDQMSSWANRGPHTAYWWVDANYGGDKHTMAAYTSAAHGGDDLASSLKIS